MGLLGGGLPIEVIFLFIFVFIPPSCYSERLFF